MTSVAVWCIIIMIMVERIPGKTTEADDDDDVVSILMATPLNELFWKCGSIGWRRLIANMVAINEKKNIKYVIDRTFRV